jgi:hypothetical protein
VFWEAEEDKARREHKVDNNITTVAKKVIATESDIYKIRAVRNIV